MAYTYEQIFAADPANPANIAQNAAITIFAPGDVTMTPLTITDPDGQPLANPLTVNANGFGSAFAHATLDRVAWAGGGFTGFFTSYEGMKQVAVDAQAAAEAAAATAGADAAAVATAAIGDATDDAAAAAASAATAASNASASATAAANSAALVGAPADAAVETLINSASATKAALNATYAPVTGSTAYASPAAVTAAVAPKLDTAIAAATYVAGLIISGTGIDPTNTTDSTAAIQAKLNTAGAFGADVYLPYGKYNCTGTLTISSKIRLHGPGILNFTAGVTNSACMAVTADGVTISGITVLNPNYLASATGGKNTGILITASNIRITETIIDGMQNGIVVQPDGEYSNIVIANNRVKDVNGAGGGRGSASTYGEDRGDGITVWGCQATVTGNVVNAKTGTDARVGIHAEALGGSNTLAAPHPDAMVTMTGNVVYGPFRRGMTMEGISYGTMTGNSIADATWWAIAVIYGRACTVGHNAITWTAVTADNQGSAWNPIRGPIMVLGDSQGHIVAGNSAEIAGNAQIGINVKVEGVGRPNDVHVDNNAVKTYGSGTVTTGVMLDTCGVARVTNNTLKGYTGQGVGTWDAADFTIDNNSLTGTSNYGVHLDGTAHGGSISGNKIRSATTAISVVSQVDPMKINNNDIKTATTGIDLWGTASPTVVTGNVFSGVTTKIANAGGSVVTAGNTP